MTMLDKRTQTNQAKPSKTSLRLNPEKLQLMYSTKSQHNLVQLLNLELFWLIFTVQ